MTQIDVSTLEGMLASDPYNTTLLSIILNHHVAAKDRSAIRQLVDRYRSEIACPPEAKILLAKGCMDLQDYPSALSLLESNLDAPSLLLKARCHLAEQALPAAKEAYLRAIENDAGMQDAELETLLHINAAPVSHGVSQQNNILPFTAKEKPANLKVVNAQPLTFNDVGGLAEVKKQITRRIIAPFSKPSIFQRFKRRVGGGILLYGPPGCGKTLLARATAGECNASFYNVMLTDILSKWIGESERNLHEVFESARQNKPAVIFFDEIEAISSRRQYNDNGSQSSASLTSLFLTELDGFNQNNDGILILAATNTPWAIDSAFRRPGRFDREIFVPPPDVVARTAILENLLSDKPKADDINIEAIAKKTVGFSGADLKHLIETAEDEAIDQMMSGKQDVLLDQSLLKIALKQVSPSTTEWLAIARNYVEFANDGGKYNDVKEFLEQYAKR